MMQVVRVAVPSQISITFSVSFLLGWNLKSEELGPDGHPARFSEVPQRLLRFAIRALSRYSHMHGDLSRHVNSL